MKIPTRNLGPNGPEVPVFALGSWNTWDRMTPDEAVAILHRAVEVGANFFDVAYYNMGPHAEHSRTDILFSEAVRAAGLEREDYQVCGKLWLWEYPDISFREQMEISLERAQLDRFDMVVVGDYMTAPNIESVVTDVNELIAENMFDYWGINNWVISETSAALDFAKKASLVPPIFAQLKYGPVRRTMTEGKHYGPLFADGTLGLQASDSLEGGILAGKGVPNRKLGADVGAIREKIYEALPTIKRIAAEFDATPVQLALAFCLANPTTANILFGVSRLEQLNDNLGAIELAAREGAKVREALAPAWLDRDVPAEGGW